MSKDKQQRLPEAPVKAEPPTEPVKPAKLCLAVSKAEGKYLLEELHLDASGKEVFRKQMRPARDSIRVIGGYASIDMEYLMREWQKAGLL